MWKEASRRLLSIDVLFSWRVYMTTLSFSLMQMLKRKWMDEKKTRLAICNSTLFFTLFYFFPFSLSLPRYSFECVFSDACLDSASFRYFGYYLSYNLENDETFSVWFYQYIDSRRVKANPLLLDGNHDDVSKHTHALISFAISVSLSPFLQWFLPIFTWSLLRLCFIILVFDYDGI